MKVVQKIVIILSVMFLSNTFAQTNASLFDANAPQPVPTLKYWTLVGNPIPSGGQDNFVINTGGIPYQAQIEAKQDGSYLIAASTLQDGTWVPAGQPLLSKPGNVIYSFSMALNQTDPNARPYISYVDNVTDDYGPFFVDYFNGSSWEPVGADTLPSSVDAGAIAVSNDGTPYVVVILGALGKNTTVEVLKFNGTIWETVGNVIPFPSTIYTCPLKIQIAMSDTTPYILYGSPGNVQVMKLVNNTWVQLGTNIGSTSLQAYQAAHLNADVPGIFYALAVSPQGVPFVFHAIDKYGMPQVLQWNSNDNKWVALGTFPGFDENQHPFASFLSITTSATGMPYITFTAQKCGLSGPCIPATIFAMTLNNTMTQWVPIANTNISPAGNDCYDSIVLDAKQNPYLSYFNNNSDIVEKLS